ncbi:8-amino-7-oxononanoate synthase [Myceligenerans crystallogenes]|uniref:8-amino-7-oxononanoate synthase n=1 Tax=Myceligenerans crystallogenes TaxID=316335 RepID=A0ABN2N977_9MICO
MQNDPFGWIAADTERRRAAGLLREVRPREAAAGTLDLASNDYLSLARHSEVTAAAAGAARTWGAGATGSRLVTGSTSLHATLEAELAEFCGFEAALVFATGYAANLGALAALAPRGSLIVSDAGNHASVIDGCRLAGGEVRIARHASPDDVAAGLVRPMPDAGDDAPAAGVFAGPALVVTDGVFSVEGDLAPLRDLARVCRDAGAGLLVDDAHGLGVVGDGGRGSVHDAGLAGARDVVATVTLSKALGSQGGAVLGPADVVGHLVSAARTFMFDTGLAPAAAGGALAALRVLRREPERAGRCREAAEGLSDALRAAGLDATRPGAAVVSVPAPSAQDAVAWAARCRAAGVEVFCFRPPSVPWPRLRLTAHAGLTSAEIRRAAEILAATAP